MNEIEKYLKNFELQLKANNDFKKLILENDLLNLPIFWDKIRKQCKLNITENNSPEINSEQLLKIYEESYMESILKLSSQISAILKEKKIVEINVN